MPLMNNQSQDRNFDRDNEDFRITVRIADTEPIRFEIKRSEERIYRMAEYHVNKLCADWADADPMRSTADHLARVAMAFAELYYRKTAMLTRQQQMINDFEQELDRLLEPSDEA